MPLSTAGLKFCGIDAADDLVHELVAGVGPRSARSAITQSPNWPRPPVCFLWRPCARAALRIVSTYGTRGWLQLDVDAEAALQPLDRDLDVHLREAGEQLLARLLVAADGSSVGSSSCSRRSAVTTFSSSPFAFGETAKLITGSGKSSFGAAISRSASSRRSPVTVSLSFATAPMSPAPSSSDLRVLLALEREQVPDPLLAWARALTTSSPT